MNTRNYLSVNSPDLFYFTADLIRISVISLFFHVFRQLCKHSNIGVFVGGVLYPLFVRVGFPHAQLR